MNIVTQKTRTFPFLDVPRRTFSRPSAVRVNAENSNRPKIEENPPASQHPLKCL